MWTYDEISGYWINSDTGDVSMSDPTVSALPGDWTAGASMSPQEASGSLAPNSPLTAQQQVEMQAAGKPLISTDPSLLNQLVTIGGAAVKYVAQKNAAGQTYYVAKAQPNTTMLLLLGVGAFFLMRGK